MVVQIQNDLKTLYKASDDSLLSIRERLGSLEAAAAREGGGSGGTGGGRGGRDYIPLNNQLPEVFDNDLKAWRSWKTDLLSYADSVTAGMKKFLTEVEGMNESPNIEWLNQFSVREKQPFIVEDQVKIWRLLKKSTKGEARKIVEAIRDEDGYYAWRQLTNNYEPAMASRHGTSLAGFLAMVALKSSPPDGTNGVLNELEQIQNDAAYFSARPVADDT